jgi:hypothetical protein
MLNLFASVSKSRETKGKEGEEKVAINFFKRQTNLCLFPKKRFVLLYLLRKF